MLPVRGALEHRRARAGSQSEATEPLFFCVLRPMWSRTSMPTNKQPVALYHPLGWEVGAYDANS